MQGKTNNSLIILQYQTDKAKKKRQPHFDDSIENCVFFFSKNDLRCV